MLGWGFYLFGLCASLAAAYFVATRWHMAVGLFILPVSAWFIARVLIETGAVSWNWLRQGQMAPWDGRYYEFAGRQLRTVELEQGLALFESDLLAAVGLEGSTIVGLFGPAERVKDPEGGQWLLTRAGCERLLGNSTHPERGRMRLWLEREVFGPHEKRRAL